MHERLADAYSALAQYTKEAAERAAVLQLALPTEIPSCALIAPGPAVLRYVHWVSALGFCELRAVLRAGRA